MIGSASPSQRSRSGEARPELEAEIVRLALEPRGADAEDRAAVADLIEGGCHLGDQLGSRYGFAPTIRPMRTSSRVRGPGGDGQPALEVRTVWVTDDG